MGALWTFLRLCGIVVGIATLLRLATIGFNVEFNDVFQAFLDRMRAFFELDAVIDVIEAWLVLPALAWLRSFDLPIPDLADHWRPVFTLTWLVLAAFARNLPGNIVVNVVWAFACALIASVLAGLQALGDSALVVPLIASLILFFAISGRLPLRRVSLGLIAICAAGYAVTMALAALFKVANNPALLGLVGVVGFLGLLYLLFGVRFGETLSERLTNEATAVGLDILGVMGGALAIGYLMLK